MPKCLIVADDLTGACDSAVAFARTGARTFVAVTELGQAGSPDVLAISTESRDLDPAEARRRIGRIAASAHLSTAAVIFKKIDSTLRGNTFVEIAAALDAFGCDAAVVSPAYPALGRLVQAGCLRVAADSGFAPIDIAAALRALDAGPCCHASPESIAAGIDSGVRFVSVEASCEDDLSCAAGEILALGRRVLWAGSGGLAAALAARFPTQPAADLCLPRGRVLFALGSDHPVTLAQQERLLRKTGAGLLDATSTAPGELLAVLQSGRHLVLRIPRGRVPADRLHLLLRDCIPAAVLVSGGDTLSVFCSALGIDAIEPRRELAPGIPAGLIHGGPWSGAILASKSGGFGQPADLLHVAHCFYQEME